MHNDPFIAELARRFLRVDAAGASIPSLLRGDVPLPAAVIRESALVENVSRMKAFCERLGVRLCPHGKTTMSPELFRLQLAAGAWGITVSTTQQALSARRGGARRILLANQLLGAANIAQIAAILDTGEVDFYCLVDSPAGIARLASEVRTAGISSRVQVLIEVGYAGGRAGLRDIGEVAAILDAIDSTGGALVLRGVECFEGLVAGAGPGDREEQVVALLGKAAECARRVASAGCVGPGPFILTAGGSEFYDICARELLSAAAGLGRPAEVVLRSGCYITHDHGAYARSAIRVEERIGDVAHQIGRPRAALEVWGHVQSIPEPGLAVVGVGKRHVSYDWDLPTAIAWSPRGGIVRTIPKEHLVLRLNDQHLMMALPPGSPLELGSLVGLGISHPCTTFDKWRSLWVVDDHYDVVGVVTTDF